MLGQQCHLGCSGTTTRPASLQTPSCQHCGSETDSLGTHGLSCRYSRGRHPRHAENNGIIQRSLGSAKIPCHLEPTGLYRSDGKRPDGASIVPWRAGKVLVWDATCPDTLATSHTAVAAREAGAVAIKVRPKGGRKPSTPIWSQSPLRTHSSGNPWCIWPRSPQFHPRRQTTHHG